LFAAGGASKGEWVLSWLQKTLRELMRKNEEYRLQVGWLVVISWWFEFVVLCTWAWLHKCCTE
jgi:hypothetical protein